MGIPPEDRAPTGTNWYGKSMQQMWDLVAGRQLEGHYTQASGWKRAGELAYLHKSRLQTYRERLAQAWPPESSDAAKAYLARLDELITAVDDVARVSTQNHRYSSDIPAAFYEAERKLQPIREEYNRIDRAMRNGQPVALPSGQTPERFLEGKLNEARGVMRGLSADLSLVRVSMAPPRPYLPPGGHQDGDTDYGGVVPPVIPPVTPFGGAIAPAPSVSGATLAPVPVATGPDLTGLAPPPTTITPTPTIPGTTGPVTPGTTPPPFNTGPVIGAPPPVPGLPGVGKPTISTPVIGNPGPTAGAPRAMPAGGVIGGAPGGGGMGARAGAAGARTNPVGGMIGGPGAGGVGGRGAAGTVSGRGANGFGAPMGGVPGAGRRRDEDDPDFDPDTMWAVDQGVAPVLDAPDAPGPVDPGPAIGLAR